MAMHRAPDAGRTVTSVARTYCGYAALPHEAMCGRSLGGTVARQHGNSLGPSHNGTVALWHGSTLARAHHRAVASTNHGGGDRGEFIWVPI